MAIAIYTINRIQVIKAGFTITLKICFKRGYPLNNKMVGMNSVTNAFSIPTFVADNAELPERSMWTNTKNAVKEYFIGTAGKMLIEVRSQKINCRIIITV